MSDKSYLKNYETVKQRKKKFYEKWPEGTIQTEVINVFREGEGFVIKAFGFRNAEDQRPFTGHAYQFKDSEHNINSVAWFENGEESAIGRMLDNAGFAGNDKCSRDEIVKAESKRKVKEENVTEKYVKATENPQTVKEPKEETPKEETPKETPKAASKEKENPFFGSDDDTPSNDDFDGFAGF